MNIRNHISLAVPDMSAATKWFAQVIGPSIISGGMFSLEPNVVLELIECDPSDQEPPSILDLGTLHLCFRVTDIARVAERIDSLPETTVLGDIVFTPDGPIQGNKWVYFRSPWGTLFELQEWPDRQDISLTLMPVSITDTRYSVQEHFRGSEDLITQATAWRISTLRSLL